MADKFGGIERVYVLLDGPNGAYFPVGVVRDRGAAENWMLDDINWRDFEEFDLGKMPSD